MLSRLYIEHIALIDRLDLEIPPGFVVITGETGAGKSIVIDAVNLVLGERADRDLIQSDQSQARVEAIFELADPVLIQRLEERGIPLEDGQLILSRELTTQGRNNCRINGRLSSVSMLKEASDLLIDIHGQHEHQNLLNVAQHIVYLDAYGGDAIEKKKGEYREKYTAWRDLSHRLKHDVGSAAERARQRDILTFQIREITAINPLPEEEKNLLEERARLMNHERMQSSIQRTVAALAGEEDAPGALSLCSEANAQLKAIAEFGEKYASLQGRIDSVYYELEDIAGELQHEEALDDFDPYRYDQVEKRLEELHDLKRKYGETLDEVLRFRTEAQLRLDELEQREALAERGEALLRETEEACFAAASSLHKQRQATALLLKEALENQFRDLSLEKTVFSVNFAPLPALYEGLSFHENGLDEVEFLLSTNPGEPLKPLRKVASGGELSRIMLAFKTISAESMGCETLIFDEIDTGISGKTAAIVGEKMRTIAQTHQVICVTHSAQIAAQADAHFCIEKFEEDARSHTQVTLLDEQGHVEELARIVSGTEATPEALAHARELVRRAKKEGEAKR